MRTIIGITIGKKLYIRAGIFTGDPLRLINFRLFDVFDLEGSTIIMLTILNVGFEIGTHEDN